MLTFNFYRAILTLVMNMLNINATSLHKMFRDFHTLTGMKVVLFNKNKEEILEYPPSKNTFCDIISKDAHWKKSCDECDCTNAELCSKEEKALRYSCHLGLTEAVTPIYDNEGLLGYVMFGQVLVDDCAENTKKTLKSLFNEKDFPGIGNAIENIPVKTSAELDACVTILQAITVYMLSNQWVTPQRSGFIRHMDKFIETNLEKPITVDDICEEFHIRRTRLYSVAKDYLGCSIAVYIRNQRIHHACRMLRETDDSIISIAYKSGFSDYGYFSRIFRKVQGISATSYRNQYRTKVK